MMAVKTAWSLYPVHVLKCNLAFNIPWMLKPEFTKIWRLTVTNEINTYPNDIIGFYDHAKKSNNLGRRCNLNANKTFCTLQQPTVCTVIFTCYHHNTYHMCSKYVWFGYKMVWSIIRRLVTHPAIITPSDLTGWSNQVAFTLQPSAL